MFQRILVPLDGSAYAERAVPVAARIARASGGTIILVRVVPVPIEYQYSPYVMQMPRVEIESLLMEELAVARQYLESVTKLSVMEGMQTEIEAQSGLATSIILAVAEARKADLIVMSSHGYTGLKRWVLGSVALKVVRLAKTPVLVVREEKGDLSGTEGEEIRALVPLDGSIVAKSAIVPAAHLLAGLAAPGKGTLHLLRVEKLDRFWGAGDITPDDTLKEQMLYKARTYLQSVSEHVREGIARKLNVNVTSSLALDTDVASALIRVAEQGEEEGMMGSCPPCNLIVMATHGRGGLQRWAMGSVTERILHTTKLPLLIVRPTHDDESLTAAHIEAHAHRKA